MPAGVFPELVAIHARRRSSDLFVELARRLSHGPVLGETATKLDPIG